MFSSLLDLKWIMDALVCCVASTTQRELVENFRVQCDFLPCTARGNKGFSLVSWFWFCIHLFYVCFLIVFETLSAQTVWTGDVSFRVSKLTCILFWEYGYLKMVFQSTWSYTGSQTPHNQQDRQWRIQGFGQGRPSGVSTPGGPEPNICSK